MSGRDVPRVLFFTDNGHGLGHLTRMSAVAREARGRFQPVFLTLSMGFSLLQREGLPAEFTPSYSQIGLTKQEWSPFLAMRVAEAVDLSRARVVVVDHVMPPACFGMLKSITSGVRFVWSRRGLWRAGRNEDYLGMVRDFHTVVEPGDLAAPIDLGGTVRQRHRVQKVDPVVLVQPEEYLSRPAARQALGIPSDGRAILLQLSHSNTGRLRGLIEQARKAVGDAVGDEPVHIFTPVHPLHRVADLGEMEGVIMAPVYPVARYFKAFDGAISMTGYNSYHELIVSGLPAIFVARDTDSLDDQSRRAQFAELIGRAFWVPSLDDPDFVGTLERLLRPEEAEIAAASARELGPMAGALGFADLLHRLAKEAQTEELKVGTVEPSEATREALETRLTSGTRAGEGGVEPVVVVAAQHATEQLEHLAAEIEELQHMRPAFAPVFLLGSGAPEPVVSRGFVFESVMTPDEWETVSPRVPYADYIQARVDGMQLRYGAQDVMRPEPAPTAGVAPDAGVERDRPVLSDLRSFSLRLPSFANEAERALAVEVASSLYVPRKLEELGLCGYEPMSLACWLAILSLPGEGAAYDVGANVGPYAWLAAALSGREVVAFEPVDELVEAIAAVARRNRLDIRLERAALSDHEGPAPLFLSDRTDSSHSLMPGFRESSQSIDVHLRTLDTFVPETGIVPFAIKIDTETHEPEVLAGARNVLSKHRPWLIVEVLTGRTEERLMEVLSPFEYEWYPIGESLPFEATKRIEGDPTYQNTNWLLAPAAPDEAFWADLARWKARLDACHPDV